MIRKRHFKVSGFQEGAPPVRFNGATAATMTVTLSGTHQIVTVRPKNRRKTFTVSLADVASWVIWEAMCREKPKLRNLKPRRIGR
jgi:hypothetical protein